MCRQIPHGANILMCVQMCMCVCFFHQIEPNRGNVWFQAQTLNECSRNREDCDQGKLGIATQSVKLRLRLGLAFHRVNSDAVRHVYAGACTGALRVVIFPPKFAPTSLVGLTVWVGHEQGSKFPRLNGDITSCASCLAIRARDPQVHMSKIEVWSELLLWLCWWRLSVVKLIRGRLCKLFKHEVIPNIIAIITA
jgi:hypothetical protein